MARVTLNINDDILEELRVYIERTYGKGHRVLSSVVQQSIIDFLRAKREEAARLEKRS